MVGHKGRRRIYTDEKFITKQNVRQIVLDALIIHESNVIDIKHLFDIEKNIQSLSREKAIRPEINILATDPIASQIVDFKQGYEHGKPILYTQRARIDGRNATEEKAKEDDIRIATLNEMMRECKKASKDSKMARDIKICGLGYRYIVPKDRVNGISPFEIYTLNPLRTFIIYSNDVYCKPMASVTYTVNSVTHIKKFSVWTDNFCFEFDTAEPVTETVSYVNQIGKNPIIGYINNHDIMGSFEKELELIDAYNIVTSDRVNDICQQVQSILWMHNTKLDKEKQQELVEGGVLQTQSNADGTDAKIQYITAPLKQSDIQTLASALKERILESAGVPKLSEGSNSTGEAMRVTNGWHTAETQAKTSELTWRESEDEMLEVCLEIIKNSNVDENNVSSLKLSDIDYDMHRSENYDIVSRVNAFVTLTDRGYDIEKSAQYCKITEDPLQFSLDSKENVDKLRFGNINSAEVVENETVESPKTEESIQPSTVKH